MEKRYEALGQFYRQLGLEEDAAWVGSRLEKIREAACAAWNPCALTTPEELGPTAADSSSNLDEFPRAEG